MLISNVRALSLMLEGVGGGDSCSLVPLVIPLTRWSGDVIGGLVGGVAVLRGAGLGLGLGVT